MGVGLALSGGGIRGAAHIGVIKALKENKIEIDSVAGTSAGAIVAALFAMGYTANEMIKLFEYFAKDIMEISPSFLFNSIRRQRSIKLQGLASSLGIENAVKEAGKLKKIKKISDIKMPIAIPSTDLIQNKKIVFTNQNIDGKNYINDIEIGKAVRASATFPGMYEPFEYKEYQFVDGGIFDNLPVRELQKITSDKVMAIKFGVSKNRKEKTMYNISMKSLDLMQEGLMKDDIRKADCVLSIDLRDVKVFNVDKVRFCFEQGYMQTKSKMEEIKQKLY